MNHADKTIATKRVRTTVATAALCLASWLGSGEALGQSMVSSTLLKDQGVKKPTLRLFWTPPGGREEPVPAAAYTHRP